MGIYLNPGYENFKTTLSADIYVDKTMMIDKVNRFIDKGDKYICMSRPRRFGKTIAGNMLSSYYSKGCDSHALFENLKISSVPDYKEKLNKYNVIKIDLNSEYQNTEDKENLIKILSEDIKEEMRETFPNIEFAKDDTLGRCILKVYKITGETFIIIIDEYDVLVREKVDGELFSKYLSFLNGLFKSDTLRPAISLAYLTGILPVVRDRVQSKLNNFKEYTILDAEELAEFSGFTAEEVQVLCKEYDMDFDELRRWYDGYSQRGVEIYSPESVVTALRKGECGSYWNLTSTYRVISDKLEENFYGLKDAVVAMLGGESVDVKVSTYMNTMTDFVSKDDVLTYLIHLGYLAYDRRDKTCRIPNMEIWEEWESAVSILDEYAVTDRIIKASKELLMRTIDGNEDAVAKALDESHINATSNRSYNNEDALQSAIYLAYLYAINKYTIIREATAGKGFADVVFIPLERSDPAMVIELKKNDCAESAVNQIREKKYFTCMEHYKGNLLFVGINYDADSKTHSCKIEKFVKEEDSDIPL